MRANARGPRVPGVLDPGTRRPVSGCADAPRSNPSRTAAVRALALGVHADPPAVRPRGRGSRSRSASGSWVPRNRFPTGRRGTGRTRPSRRSTYRRRRVFRQVQIDRRSSPNGPASPSSRKASSWWESGVQTVRMSSRPCSRAVRYAPSSRTVTCASQTVVSPAARNSRPRPHSTASTSLGAARFRTWKFGPCVPTSTAVGMTSPIAASKHRSGEPSPRDRGRTGRPAGLTMSADTPANDERGRVHQGGVTRDVVQVERVVAGRPVEVVERRDRELARGGARSGDGPPVDVEVAADATTSSRSAADATAGKWTSRGPASRRSRGSGCARRRTRGRACRRPGRTARHPDRWRGLVPRCRRRGSGRRRRARPRPTDRPGRR